MTPKKKIILDLILQGLSNYQIAEKTGVTVKVVKYHLTGIYKFYQVSSSRQLVAKLTDKITFVEYAETIEKLKKEIEFLKKEHAKLPFGKSISP